jgi:predicted site-specific integrase-resolvase
MTMTQSNLIALNVWIQQVGITPVTAWRWRKRGMINPVNICGRLYLTAPDLEQFSKRASVGEFAQEAKTPKKEAA